MNLNELFCKRNILVLIAVSVLLIVALVIGSRKSTPGPGPRPDGIVPIANTTDVHRRCDVVFIHGLGGDGRGTWQAGTAPPFYWPEELGKDIPDAGVWVVNYDAQISEWLGHTMPIEVRSQNLLNRLKNAGIGERRIVFVAHSLGGLLVKQMLQDSTDLQVKDWHDIGLRTKGVVFLGTPNTGSNEANAVGFLDKLAPVLRTTITQQQLTTNAPILMRLNTWYRNNADILEINTLAFFETKPTFRTIIVDQASADPGIPRIRVVGVDEDHLSICKPQSKTADVYQSVMRFINEEVIPLPTTYDISFANFELKFNEIKNDFGKLDEFKKQHVGQEVVWDAVVQKVTRDKKKPSMSISVNDHSETLNWVVASFRPWEFDYELEPGTSIKISGLLRESTNSLGAFLEDCKIIKPHPQKTK